MSCSKFEPLLAGKLFGDLSPAEQRHLEAHLQSCAACRGQFAALQKVAAAMGPPVRPEMPPHFWEGYWPRLLARMEKEAAQPSRRAQMMSIFPFWGRPAFQVKWIWQAAAAMALLVLGVIIGQNWPTQSSLVKDTNAPPASAAIPARQVEARTAQLLERSKILLIGIVNDDFEGASSSDLARQRKVSRALLQETRALQMDLSSAPDQRMQHLLQQLELVLVQIANLEIEHDLSGVEMVREGIDREGLLMKINIEELSRAAQKQMLRKQPNKEIL